MENVKTARVASSAPSRQSRLSTLAQGVREFLRKLKPHSRRQTGSPDPKFEINISEGCDSECTYCAVRFANGPLKSKPVEIVVDEFRLGLRDGKRIFTVCAQDVGAYGRDFGGTLPDLLERLLSQNGDYRIRLIGLNPCWLNLYLDDLTKLMRSRPGVFTELMAPVQSGSDRILGMMKRKYTSGEAAAALDAVRAAAPDIILNTQIMVGFPCETDDDFARSVDFVRNTRLDRVDVYKYQDQPGTGASALPGKVSEDVKACRLAEIYKVAKSNRQKRS